MDPVESNRGTLSKNDHVLHSVYDSGVGCLPSDSEFDLEHELKKQRTKVMPSVETPTTKMEQIAVLEASLPENTLQKLSLGQLGSVFSKETTFNAANSYISMLYALWVGVLLIE